MHTFWPQAIKYHVEMYTFWPQAIKYHVKIHTFYHGSRVVHLHVATTLHQNALFLYFVYYLYIFTTIKGGPFCRIYTMKMKRHSDAWDPPGF